MKESCMSTEKQSAIASEEYVIQDVQILKDGVHLYINSKEIVLSLELPNLKTVVFNSNRENTNVILGQKNRIAYGNGYITDRLCGLNFKISPFSFRSWTLYNL